MTGYFDENNNPRVDVTVIGQDRQIKVSALIDTGSQVPFMLALEHAVSIGLKLIAVTPVELADGSIRKEHVYAGEIVLGKEAVPVDIMLTTGESLLGIPPLKRHRLTIDFPHRKVALTPTARD